MSEKTHCDRCDRVIPPGEERLCLKPSLQTGGEGVSFPDWREEFCLDPCVYNDPTLLAIWEEAHNQPTVVVATG